MAGEGQCREKKYFQPAKRLDKKSLGDIICFNSWIYLFQAP